MRGKASGFHFRMMVFAFKVRDLFLPPQKIVEEVSIKPGHWVLDYGCGPGSYTIPAAQLAGASGRVYALDMNPSAVRTVERKAAKRGLGNVITILSDCATGLGDESIDMVLLYDTLHMLHDPGRVLAEMRRILKPEGLLSCRDHHMDEGAICSILAGHGFILVGRKKRSLHFSKRLEE